MGVCLRNWMEGLCGPDKVVRRALSDTEGECFHEGEIRSLNTEAVL